MFVKVVKNRSYFKRFQVKYRRRREGKTDYYARRRLVAQDKDKYNAPKYRLVVRITNKDVTAQIVYSEIVGDKVFAAAYAHELPNHGLTVGLTNYAACYATGLLLARRLLAQIKIDKLYAGNSKVDGALFNSEVSAESQRRPFKALLDVGLARTTTGARIFGVLKGAVDGGIFVPHSDSRFPGNSKEGFKAEVHKKYIFGGHVASYMKELQEEDPEKFATHFSRFVKAGVTAENLESLYKQVHASIRANPASKKTEKKSFPKKHFNPVKLTLAQRKERIAAKKIALGMA